MRQFMAPISLIVRYIGMLSYALFLGSALSLAPAESAQTLTFTTINPSGSISTWANGISGTSAGTGSGTGSGTSTGTGHPCQVDARRHGDDNDKGSDDNGKDREHRHCRDDRRDHHGADGDRDDQNRSYGAGLAPTASATPATSGGTALIVGYYYNSGWFSYLDTGGTFTTVTVQGATSTFASGVNTSGQIVGHYYDSSFNTHGFLLSGSVLTTIDAPGAVQPYGTIVTGLNGSGQVVGYYEDSAGVVHGFLWSAGTFTTIDYPEATGTYPTAINNSGVIVGYFTEATDSYRHGWERSGSTMTAINVSGASETMPQGINTSGQIVGAYLNASGQTSGFELSGTTVTTINVPSATSTMVSGIDDAGQMVGEYTDSTMTQYGFSSP
jgi:probable HAF family extracellular repeat protein